MWENGIRCYRVVDVAQPLFGKFEHAAAINAAICVLRQEEVTEEEEAGAGGGRGAKHGNRQSTPHEARRVLLAVLPGVVAFVFAEQLGPPHSSVSTQRSTPSAARRTYVSRNLFTRLVYADGCDGITVSIRRPSAMRAGR